jgi:3-phenylpropionate/trans-cinnamate dioxygenase ferredoxin reductase subunit
MRIVVVGAGLAGLRTVEHLRRLGHDGPLTLIGSETHLPYDRPPLSKEVLRGERPVVYLREESTYDDLDLDVHLGTEALAVDADRRAVQLVGDEVVSFDALVIATGAIPRTLPGSERLRGVHTLRTLEDCAALHDDLVQAGDVAVVGGGFIGCEVAASARTLGADVTIIEALPQLLIRALGDEVGGEVAALHRRNGVHIRRGAAVQVIEGADRVERVVLADGSVIPAATVVVGLGVRPATEWLEGSGIAVDNGILCDQWCQTSVPGIFAVGDAARWFNGPTGRHERVEHWTNAVEQAEVVAHNVLAAAADRRAYAPVPYFWSDQYDVKIQALGFPSPGDDVQLHTVSPANRPLALYSHDGQFTAVVGFSAPGTVMKLRPLLADGASIADAAKAIA